MSDWEQKNASANCAIPQRVPAIQRRFERISATLQSANFELDSLHDRIEPTLSKEPLPPDGAIKQDEELPTCEIDNHLENIRVAVNLLARRIASITARCQL